MARNAHTWTAKYSQAEKEAVIRAKMIHGLTYGQISTKAAAGELDGAGRFTITKSYAGKLCRAARLKVDPAKLSTPESQARAIQTARSGALAVILREWERWNIRARAGDVDLPQHARLMRALSEHEKGARAKPGQDEPVSPDEKHNTTQDALAQLLSAVSNGSSTNGNEGAIPVSSAHARSA